MGPGVATQELLPLLMAHSWFSRRWHLCWISEDVCRVQHAARGRVVSFEHEWLTCSKSLWFGRPWCVEGAVSCCVNCIMACTLCRIKSRCWKYLQEVGQGGAFTLCPGHRVYVIGDGTHQRSLTRLVTWPLWFSKEGDMDSRAGKLESTGSWGRCKGVDVK